MAQESTDLICNIGFTWKPSSLNTLFQPSEPPREPVTVRTPEGSLLSYKHVESIDCLGCQLNSSGCSYASMYDRLSKAEKKFWSNSKVLLGPGSIGHKIGAWQRGPASSAIFSSATWHVTATLLRALKKWEFKYLRKALHLRRKPSDSGHSAYMHRTARKIEGWYHASHVGMCHHKVLQNVFRAAWKESHCTVECGDAPLLEARTYRDRIWWHSIKDVRYSHRAREGCLQRRPGDVPAWEDPLVTVFGLDWHEMRSRCADKSEWLRLERQFINSCCAERSLPVWRRSQMASSQGSDGYEKDRGQRTGEQSTRHIHQMPTCEELSIPHECTHSRAGTIHFVIDCQPVCNIVCGKASLKDAYYRPIFVRICRKLQRTSCSLGLGITAIEQPVMWVERTKNQLADTLCNYTMDRGHSWHHEWKHRELTPANMSVVGFSDGGRRSESCAASAWALAIGTVMEGNWSYRLVMAGGTFHARPMHAFLAEAIALEECTTAAARLLTQ